MIMIIVWRKWNENEWNNEISNEIIMILKCIMKCNE
jgi:hypothetical protein